MGSRMPKEVLVAMKRAKKSASSPIKFWRLPEAGKSYILGADPSSGNTGGDKAAIEVIDAGTGEQCAEYAEFINPEELAPIIIDLGKMYNNAEVAVEVNNVGLITNNLLIRKFEYENIYRYKSLDRFTNFMTDLVGWWTNDKTKRRMICVFVETVIKTPQLIHSAELMEEILNYEEDGFAPNDRLMAIMIAYAVRSERLMAIEA